MNTYKIRIEGLVQGVGFRPFIHKLAGSLSLSGTVENRNNGVFIFVNTDQKGLADFIENIRKDAPLHSKIDEISFDKIEPMTFSGFSIVKSLSHSDDITNISPDISVCADCLSDMDTQHHRKNYPLINCTNCGPRFSIIKGVPYDRKMTTMSEFSMCDKCSEEYHNITDRRFHAQPVACNNCGPYYSIHIFSSSGGGNAVKQQWGLITDNKIKKNISDIVIFASQLIDKGSVIGLKGTGGYHLLCNAENEKTVHGLRVSKGREGKPFAVMCRDMAAAENIAFLNSDEKKLLTSWRRPVVLLKGKGMIAPSVTNGLDTVGVILPYMPFHYMLFDKLISDVIVFTSANFSDEPVVISDEIALAEMQKLADAVITYNRDIYNRSDDSVCRAIQKREFIIRRSRGYAPTPLNISLRTEGIFGAGAELANCFAIGKGKQVILSQHIGDLKNSETLDFYSSTYKRFVEMFRFKPEIIAKDLHPDYLSSSFAADLASETDIKFEEVQHHHAHIASCMADNGLNEKVIGVALDGVGLGTDRTIWGGEFLVGDLCNFERFMHFENIPIAGADKISPEPWRSAVAYMAKYGMDPVQQTEKLKMREIGSERIRMYHKLIDANINTCLYSGAGRLFDAIAAITGICLFSSYQAEAPMLLESAIINGLRDCYNFEFRDNEISFGNTIAAILDDVRKGRSVGEISALFHNTVIRSVAEGVKLISKMTGIRKVVLSGGTFQNKYLSEKLIRDLSDENFFVYFHHQVPANDGGLALGQVVIAAARREMGINGRI
ncbi:MAG TPA: carbamoyltransferase HypF [Bacteroidales bacterium]|nr:carbamoyltransferase HypF [Bacteroidales bacterium]